MWPEARFVVLVRDGRDVALSLLNVPFGPNNVWAAARFWAEGIRRGQDAERRFPGRVLTLRYEDIVASPGAETERLCAFLGLPFDDEMLAIERTDPAKIDKDKAEWFTSIAKGIDAAGAGRWRSAMSPHDQRLFAALAGPELEAAGYEPGPARRPNALASVLYRLQDAALRIANAVQLRIVTERGRELRYVLRRKLGRS